jgi:hypothetical protein
MHVAARPERLRPALHARRVRRERTTQEAFEQDDGSWIVRSTNVSNPQILDREGHPQVEFDTRARALYSLSYRITPVPGGEPTIEIIDSKVAFDF